MKSMVSLYNEEKLLMCGAKFVRTHNTAGIEADTQAALRGKNTIFDVYFPVVVLTLVDYALIRTPCQRTLHWREHRFFVHGFTPMEYFLNSKVMRHEKALQYADS